MKRFFLINVAALALLVPTLAAAQTSHLVYRPELRGMVLQRIPAEQVPAVTVPATQPAARAEIARHTAMAIGLKANPRGRGVAQPAAHCDRLVAQLRKAVAVERELE